MQAAGLKGHRVPAVLTAQVGRTEEHLFDERNFAIFVTDNRN